MNGRQLRFCLLVAIAFVLFLTFQSFQLSYATHSSEDVNHLQRPMNISSSSFLTTKINNNNNNAHDSTASEDLKIDSAVDTSWIGETHLGGREYNLQCWLDPAWGRPSSHNSSVTCVGKHPVIANTNATSLTCREKKDNNNTSHAPGVVSLRRRRVLQKGMTIALLYYARPSMLLHHLESLASYPLEIQQQLTLLIIDDGSPIGLRATEFLDRSNYRTTLPVRIRIARVTQDMAWNIGGARNLAFYLVDTSKVLLLDLDMIVPVETMTEVLTSQSWSTNLNGTYELAHRFNRKRLNNGKANKHPAVSVLDVASYWKSGGCDEDFVGNYGYTDVHFWHRWRLDPNRRVVEHPTTFIQEIHHEDYCSFEWLAKGQNLQETENDSTTITTTTTLHQLEQTCRTALAALKVPGKWGQQFNKIKIRQKMETGCWSNLFLRFPWVLEW
jgi:hypothetical protein